MEEQNEENSEDKTSNSEYLLGARAKNFNKKEAYTLIKFIKEHKNTLLDKSTSKEASQAKDDAWSIITNLFNSCDLPYERDKESLKMKWENLKKSARKITRNLTDVKYGDYDDLMKKVVVLLCEGECMNGNPEFSIGNVDEINGTVELEALRKSPLASDQWQDSMDAENDSLHEDEDKKYRDRSINFSVSECNRLMQCVREEKRYVFNKETNGRAIRLRNKAWDRIAQAFNKDTENKRTTKVLRTKFDNMKKMVRHNKKHRVKKCRDVDKNSPFDQFIYKSESKRIKSEKVEEDIFNDYDNRSPSPDDNFDCLPERTIKVDLTTDPLSTVLEGYTVSDNKQINSSTNTMENQEVTRLKIELLKFKLETARLKREHLAATMEADRKYHETRELESSLRVRAARLHALASQQRLIPTPAPCDVTHYPHLAPPPHERAAHAYLQQYPYP